MLYFLTIWKTKKKRKKRRASPPTATGHPAPNMDSKMFWKPSITSIQQLKLQNATFHYCDLLIKCRFHDFDLLVRCKFQDCDPDSRILVSWYPRYRDFECQRQVLQRFYGLRLKDTETLDIFCCRGKNLGLRIHRIRLGEGDTIKGGGHYRFLTVCPWAGHYFEGDIIQQHGVHSIIAKKMPSTV